MTAFRHPDADDAERGGIVINGRFLTQPVTGVQRFAREVVREIDRRIATGGLPPTFARTSFTLAIPAGADVPGDLDRIRVRTVRPWSGHLWEQTALAAAARGATLVGLCNGGPVAVSRQLVVLHDAAVYRAPGAYAWRYRTVHRLLGRALARTASLATVSAFSRAELAGALNLSADGIAVLGNGGDHFARVPADAGAVARLGLGGRRFVVLLGSRTLNKNVGLAIRAFAALPDEDVALVLVGGGHASFEATALPDDPRVVATGRLPDADVAGLLDAASAFLFPSLYEGFGIPPLEAMTRGCPVLASDIPACREVCGDAAVYFDPRDASALTAALAALLADPAARARLAAAGRARAACFTWSGVVDRLLDALSRIPGAGRAA